MKLTCLTHVVPTLSAEAHGADAYPLELARQLREHCDINSQFILCDPNWNGPAQIEGFAVRWLRFPNEARLWGMLASRKNPGAVMLHYDGHGYDKQGVPTWLYHGIKSWLADQGSEPRPGAKQFFTVFHDLWKSEPKPWRGRFYLQMMRKRLVTRLHRLSKASITCGQYRLWPAGSDRAGKNHPVSDLQHSAGPGAKYGSRHSGSALATLYGKFRRRLSTLSEKCRMESNRSEISGGSTD